jgi:hypothetical protein
MPEPIAVCLTSAATHVDVEPGGEIILRGSFTSTHDGATVDAATTTWPADAPGGGSIDSGGLIDLAGGGFHLTSRNPVTHEVHAIATGEAAPACSELGVAAPCLPLRLLSQARTRLMTVNDWKATLKGGGPGTPGCFSMEVPSQVIAIAPSTTPYLQAGGVAFGIAAVAALGWVIHRRRSASPLGQLQALAKRVQAKLRTADSVLAAPLVPAINAAIRAASEKRVDASSAEGRRVMTVLKRVEAQIDETTAKARAEAEQEVADELVREMESALEAADEASAIGARARR